MLTAAGLHSCATMYRGHRSRLLDPSFVKTRFRLLSGKRGRTCPSASAVRIALGLVHAARAFVGDDRDSQILLAAVILNTAQAPLDEARRDDTKSLVVSRFH
jgi:hypothetical protein